MANPGEYIIPDDYTTLSEQIIEYMQQTLKDALFDPRGGSSQKLFERVVRGSISDIKIAWAPSASIEEGPEKKIADLWPVTEKMLRIFVNFKVYHTRGNDLNEVGVDQYAMIRYYFGRIVSLFVTPDGPGDLGGLALACTESGNTPEVASASDKEPGGTVIFDIHYRHMYGDMFTGL